MFHFDYYNKSETYFIPFVDLTDQNGTEMIIFKDSQDFEKNSTLLNSINYIYLEKEDIIKYLAENNIDNSKYEFKIHNTNAYSLYKLPKHVFHRGKKNETNKLRILFQLVTIEDAKYIDNVADDDLIIDAELDDDYSKKDMKSYLLKFNNKFLKLSKRGKDYSYSEIEYCDNYEYSKITNYTWYITIKNGLLYIYNNSDLLLTVINNDISPFHFSKHFDDKYCWKLMSNNKLFFTENIMIDLYPLYPLLEKVEQK